MWQYELWFSRGDAGTIYGMSESLATLPAEAELEER